MPTVRKYSRDSTFTLIAGATIQEGEFLGVNGSGQAVLADSDAAAGPIVAVGFAIKPATSGNPVGVAVQGIIDGYSSLTPGARQWLSGTAGGITETRPTGAGAAVQALGVAVSATKVIVNVVPNPVVAQASGNSTVT